MAQSNTDLAKKLDSAPPLKANEDIVTQLRREFAKPSVANELKAALQLNPDITPERLLRTLITQIRKNPMLLACSLQSLMSCAIQAAEEGLDFSLGQAYAVPYKNKKRFPDGSETWVTEAQYQRGYQGLVELVMRAGEVDDIKAYPLHKNDQFTLRRGYEEVLEHIPNISDPGEVVGFYAYYLKANGRRGCEFMTKADVDKVRARSKSKDNGPWVTDYSEMGRKTVLKRLCKHLRKSVKALSAIEEEDAIEFGDATGIDLNLGALPEATEPQDAAPATEPAADAPKALDAPPAQIQQPTVTAEQANEKLKAKREQQKSAKAPPQDATSALWDYRLQAGFFAGSRLGDLKDELADIAKDPASLNKDDVMMINLALGELSEAAE